MIRDNVPNTIRGIAALMEALDVIGSTAPNGDALRDGDRALAKIIVEHELELRDLVRYSLNQLAGEE